MSLAYRVLILFVALGLVGMGMALEDVGAAGDRGHALVFALGAVGYVYLLFQLLRDAVADAVCRALTGQPMPPRNHKGPTP